MKNASDRLHQKRELLRSASSEELRVLGRKISNDVSLYDDLIYDFRKIDFSQSDDKIFQNGEALRIQFLIKSGRKISSEV